MSNQEIADLCIMTGFKQAVKKEIIYFAGEPIRYIYFLKKGIIKICQTDERGNEIIKDIIKAGDLFGELSLDANGENHEYAEALSNEVVICKFKLEDFENVLEHNPNIALRFTKIIGFRFKRLENRYSNLVFKDVRSRVIAFLRDWADREGQPAGNQTLLENYLTQEDIAKLVCSTRQSVAEVLGELEKEGLLKYGRKEIALVNEKIFTTEANKL